MTPELAAELRKYPAVIDVEQLFPPKRSAKGERQRVEGSFATILELASIQNFRFHDLRHTFASWYMMNGGDLYGLAKILGHSNIRMTERYAKLGKAHIARTGDTAREMWNLMEGEKGRGQTGPINSTMGKLLWAIRAWYAEIENDERSEAVLAGQARARANGRLVGRPRVILDRELIVRLRDIERKSWKEIAETVGGSVGSVRRACQAARPAKSLPRRAYERRGKWRIFRNPRRPARSG